MRDWAALTTVLALCACARAGPGPEKTVQTLYAPYLSHVAEHGVNQWDSAPVYSRSLRAEIDRGLTYSVLLNEPVIDFDPVANAQEYSLSNLKLTVDGAPARAKAHVTAQFDNEGHATTVGYDMVFEDQRWKIDDIRDGDDDLRKIIDDELKPIGDPAAMKSPVAMIYARYALGAPGEPLARWAPLSADLRTALDKSGPHGALDFDPACGGTCGALSGLKLEAASAAVIASFKIGGDDRVIAYDVVQDQNGWRIADIRGPLANPAWDLALKVGGGDKSPD